MMNAMRLGEVKPLSAGEIAARTRGYTPYAPETWRAWEYWANRAGVGRMLKKPGEAKKKAAKGKAKPGGKRR
jgi:hypothetical protein